MGGFGAVAIGVFSDFGLFPVSFPRPLPFPVPLPVLFPIPLPTPVPEPVPFPVPQLFLERSPKLPKIFLFCGNCVEAVELLGILLELALG